MLNAFCGRTGAVVMFIGEAPGRLGGERTSVPFSADQTGRNFIRLLAMAGLTREQVFVTNSVLCNPRDERGRNRAPSRQEMANCLPFLTRQIEMVDPRLIVPLGAVALRALDLILPHRLTLREAVATPYSWGTRFLFPLYHPGPRAQLHRPFVEQVEDFQALGRFCREQFSALLEPTPVAERPII